MRDIMDVRDTFDNRLYYWSRRLLNYYIGLKFLKELYAVYYFLPHRRNYFYDVYRNIEFLNLVLFMCTLALRYSMQDLWQPLFDDFDDEDKYVDTIKLRDVCLWNDRINAVNAVLSVMKFFKYVRGVVIKAVRRRVSTVSPRRASSRGQEVFWYNFERIR